MKSINSIYIHFPICRHLCNYCDFYKIKDPSLKSLNEFHDYLMKSINTSNQLLISNNMCIDEIDSVYIGGGTPSLWAKDAYEFLPKFFTKLGIKLKNNCEFTFEVNPGSYRREDILKLLDIGVNRFSVGLQTLNTNLITKIDRVHSIQDSFKTMNFFDSLNVNYSVDLMLGLPDSELFKRDLKKEIDDIVDFDPDHISVYILTTKSNYLHNSKLPNEQYIENEFKFVSDYLRSKGLTHYEVSNFSKKGSESFHNLQYWRNTSVLAFGPSATGFLNNGDVHLRYKWESKSPALKTEKLNKTQYELEMLYLGLRTNRGLKYSDIFKGHKLKGFKQLASVWDSSNLVEHLDESKIILNPSGFLVMDGLIDQVLSHGLM